MRRIFLFILFIVLAVIGISFAVLNAEPAQLNYYFASTEAPLSLIIVLAMAVGALLGVLATMGMVLSQKRASAQMRRKAELCEQELKNLRRIPIQDKH